MQQNKVTFVFFQVREPDLKGDRNCVALLVSRKQRTFFVCCEAQTLKWSVLLLFLLFWGGPVQSLKRTKNWTRPVHFQTIMPSSLGIYTRATNVTLLLDLAESWNLFPREFSNLCRPVERTLDNRSAKDFQPNGCESRTFGYIQHGGRSPRPHHSFCTRDHRPLGRSPCVFVGSYGQ